MKYNLFYHSKGATKSFNVSLALILTLLLLIPAFFMPAETLAQKRQITQKIIDEGLRSDNADIQEMDGTLTVESFQPNDKSYENNDFMQMVIDPNAIYSNVTNIQGFFVANGGATLIGANTITRLVADDLTLARGVPTSVTGIRFTVQNNNAGPVSVRARVRFYANNAGAPGTLLSAVSFAPFTFAPGATTLTANPFGPFTATTQTIWAGITFDNNGGTTGATAAQLNLFGMRVFDPPNRGTSTDQVFLTTAAGDFNLSNPVGATQNNAGFVDNLGWEILVTPTAAMVSLGGRVTKADGQGIYKANVAITDSSGNTRYALTSPFGYYRFDDVTTGETYIISVGVKGYDFTQSQQVVFADDENQEINFVAN